MAKQTDQADFADTKALTVMQKENHRMRIASGGFDSKCDPDTLFIYRWRSVC